MDVCVDKRLPFRVMLPVEVSSVRRRSQGEDGGDSQHRQVVFCGMSRVNFESLKQFCTERENYKKKGKCHSYINNNFLKSFFEVQLVSRVLLRKRARSSATEFSDGF